MVTDGQVLAELAQLREGDLPTHGGRTLAYVYDSGLTGLDELAAAAHAGSAHANGLDPTAFGSIAAMEADLVATAAALLGGADRTVGTVTSGGTESCLLAVHTARAAHPEITRPRMVLPSTAHAAFFKAAELFGVQADVVGVDPVTFRADSLAMTQRIGPDTVLMVASAPSYAHGVLDPIVEVAAAAADRGVRCHVDACIGGWVLGGLRAAGRPVPDFDLSVPGVTSLSVDLHKYAYAPKGTSVLLHADEKQRAPGYFVFTDWPGYTMLNTTLQSTRSGGPVAAAWATVRRIGAGYADLAVRAVDAARRIRSGVAAIEGLRVLGDPQSTLFAVAGDGLDVFVLADEMTVRGYYVQPQFAHGPSPANVHLTVTAANHGHEDELIGALAEAAAAARDHGPVSLPEAVLLLSGSAQPLPDNLIQLLAGDLGLLAADGTLRLPQRMATVNALLNVLPGPLRAQILRDVLGMIHRGGRSLLEAG